MSLSQNRNRSKNHGNGNDSSIADDNSNQELRPLADYSSIQQSQHNIDIAYHSPPYVLRKLHMIAGFGFALFGSVITWIMFVVWLFKYMGGLGPRSSTGVTTEYFNWHIFCMSTAFLLFMTTSVLSFEIMPFKRNVNKNIHWVTNTCAFILAISGFSIVIDCHQILSDNGSFLTVHSVVGLITLLLFTANFMHGVLVYLLHYFVCQDIGGWGFFGVSESSKMMHKRIGFMVVLLGFMNMIVGLEKYSTLTGSALALLKAVAVGIIVVLVGIVSNLVSFRSKSDRFRPLQSPQSLPDDEENQNL